jgi:hypothetical protein
MDDIENDTITIDNTIINSTGGYATINSMNTANTMWASGSSSIYNIPSAGTGGQIYTTNGTSGIQVKGDAEFEGKVTINGRDISKLFERIEDRLAILMEPDPEKLEKFAALKKAYDNYKLLEKLIGDDEPNEQR